MHMGARRKFYGGGGNKGPQEDKKVLPHVGKGPPTGEKSSKNGTFLSKGQLLRLPSPSERPWAFIVYLLLLGHQN